MASAIDPTLGGTLTGSGEISTSEMQEALAAAQSEITALQASLLTLLFISLDDVPNSYATFKKQRLRVNIAETGLEFIEDTGHQEPGRDTVGDADKTLAVGTARFVQDWSTTLTAQRTCTLPASGRYTGLRYVIQRTAGGNFNLVVSGLDSGGSGTFNLRQNEFLKVYFDGTDWKNEGFGLLSRQFDMRDSLLRNAKIEAFTEAESAVSPSSNIVTLDCSAAQVFVVTASANITSWALTNVDSGAHTSALVYFVQDSTGGRTNAWTFTINGNAATVKWSGGSAPTVSSAANAVDIFQFTVRSASLTTLYGFTAGQAFA